MGFSIEKPIRTHHFFLLTLSLWGVRKELLNFDI
jgi:hypothetical protein